MSDETFKCLLTTVTDIQKAANSDKLFSVWCLGWVFISAGHFDEEGNLIPPYKIGDKVVYIQPDSLLDAKLIRFAFPDGLDGKIKPDSLEKHRVRVQKIRKNLSEGMLLNPDALAEVYPEVAKAKIGDDIKRILNITKYEPPAYSIPRHMNANGVREKHPLFKEYIDINNQKYYPDLFQDGEPVYITEKLHGTSARYSLLPTHIGPCFREGVPIFRNIKRRLMRLFGLLPKHEFCVGSRRVEISLKGYKNGFYSSDVYTKVANQENLKGKLDPGIELFGEIVGDGIQGGYIYGCKQGEHRFFAYDIYDHNQQRWLNPTEFIQYCIHKEIPFVPVLEESGNQVDNPCKFMTIPANIMLPYSTSLIEKLKKGNSTIGNQKIREGVVVKSAKEERDPRVGRKVLKCISDDYLTQKNLTEFH